MQSRGYSVKLKGLTQPSGDGLSEQSIKLLERSEFWPFEEMSQTMLVGRDQNGKMTAKVLKLERFYWGIRQMVVRLTQQSGLMGQAEQFLCDIAEPTSLCSARDRTGHRPAQV